MVSNRIDVHLMILDKVDCSLKAIILPANILNADFFVHNVCPNYTRKTRVKEIDGPGNREPLMNSKYDISCNNSTTLKSA